MQFCYEKCFVTKIVDGDTFDAIVDLGFNIKTKKRFRLLGVDVFETRLSSKVGHITTKEQKKLGLLAKVLLQDLILDTVVKIKSEKSGKYGRWLADVTYYHNGEQKLLKQTLIEYGYVK